MKSKKGTTPSTVVKKRVTKDLKPASASSRKVRGGLRRTNDPCEDGSLIP